MINDTELVRVVYRVSSHCSFNVRVNSLLVKTGSSAAIGKITVLTKLRGHFLIIFKELTRGWGLGSLCWGWVGEGARINIIMMLFL